MKNTRTSNLTRRITRGGLIAALYVVLTMLSSLVGLSSGVIQCRISEALCVLPIFFPEATLGLFIGCLISNILASGAILDIIFGSLATLIGAYFGYLIGKAGERFFFLVPIPTVLANMIIVPPVLIFVYGATESYPFLLLTVGVGEIISAWVFGIILLRAMVKVIRK